MTGEERDLGRRPCPAGGLQKKAPLALRTLFSVQLTKGEGGPGNVYRSAGDLT